MADEDIPPLAVLVGRVGLVLARGVVDELTVPDEGLGILVFEAALRVDARVHAQLIVELKVQSRVLEEPVVGLGDIAPVVAVGGEGALAALARPLTAPPALLHPPERPLVVIAKEDMAVGDRKELIDHLVDLGPAVADVAETDEEVLVFVETRSLKTLHEGLVRAVDVADDVAGH